jgi:hypothetical protein
MPCPAAVRNWAKADAAFGAALAAARRRAQAGLRQFDAAQAEAFLARARAGERIHDLLRQPDMPGRRTYRYWIATQAEFAEAVHGLHGGRKAQVGAMGRARRRGFDPVLADRIVVGLWRGARLEDVLAGDPELPCKPTLRRWRREAPEFDRVLRAVFDGWRDRRALGSSHWTPEMGARIVARIVEGASFASLGREPGMPSRQTLRRWAATRPEFAAEVAQACIDREDWYNDQIQIIAERAGPLGWKAARARAAPLSRHLARLRHRPGTPHRRAGHSPDPQGRGGNR